MMNAEIGKRTRKTNRRVWKLRILQHIARRKVCWESMPNIARSLRIGRKRLTRYLDELRAGGLIETKYRAKQTNVHRTTKKGFAIFPALIDDLKLPPKQANALTALFHYSEIPMREIASKTLCGINTARRAVWNASKAGLLKITEQPGFEHWYSWNFKVCKALRGAPTKSWRKPLSKLKRVKPLVIERTLGRKFASASDEEKQANSLRWSELKKKLNST